MTYDTSKDVSGLKVYLNKVLQTATTVYNTFTGDSSSPGIKRCIGSRNGANLYLGGGVDELGIWDRVLTPTEITELYNSGVGKQYPN